MSTSVRRRAKAALTLATALAAFSIALAGCSGGSSGDPTATDSPTSSSGIVQGDTLTMAMSAPSTGMNPFTVNTAFVSYVLPMYEPLVYYGPGGVYEPRLAESWEVAEGNTAITLQIRQGVTFTTGETVNAEAAKASLEYCATAASRNAAALNDLESISVDGEYTLTLHLSQPNPLIMDMVSQVRACGMIVSPSGLADVDNLTVDNPSAGAGQYIYDPAQSVAGDTYVYTLNPDYYAPERQYWQKLVLRVIMEAQATYNALITGQVDIAGGSTATIAQAATDANVNLVWTPVTWAGLNLIDRKGELNPAMGDVRVRQAINYAINRDAITAALFGEFGVATSSPSAEGYDGWTQAAQDYYPYDVEKAQSLMAEAGYADGFTLKVCTVAWGGLDVLVTAVTPMLAEIGITVDANVTTDEQAYAGCARDMEHSAVAVGYGSLPMFRMGSDLVVPGGSVFNGFNTDDPGAMALFETLRVASQDEIVPAAQALNTYLVEEAWFAPVLFAPMSYYASPRIAGLDVSGGRSTVSVLDLYLA